MINKEKLVQDFRNALDEIDTAFYFSYSVTLGVNNAPCVEKVIKYHVFPTMESNHAKP